MRLVLFGPGRPFRGGVASTTTALALALQARGHDLCFLKPRRQYPSFLYPGVQDVDPEACPEVPGSQSVYAPFEAWGWMRALNRALEFEADAWLFPYWTWAWVPFFRSVLWAAGSTPVVSIVHNLADHGAGRVARGAARLVLEKCDGFLTHAEQLAEALRREFPGRSVAVQLLPAAELPKVRPSRHLERERLGLREGEKLAVFLGLIRPYKGVDLLVEAFKHLPESSPWQLFIAGEAWGELAGKLKGQVEESGLGGRVRFRFRWQTQEEVESLLAAADLLVLPYRSGSQSAVAPLGLSRGVPVLASRVGGLPEIIFDGVNGMLVDPGSAGPLKRAFLGLKEEELTRLRQGASRSVERQNWDSYAETLERQLASIVLA